MKNGQRIAVGAYILGVLLIATATAVESGWPYGLMAAGVFILVFAGIMAIASVEF